MTISHKRIFILSALVALLGSLASITISAAPGDLDMTFGSGGKVTGRVGYANGVAIQPDGKIVAVTADFSLARYNSDGSPDVTFGDKGSVTTYLGPDGGSAFEIAIQSDGKIVVGGYACPCDDYGAASFAIARYNPDGSLDLSFDGDGKVMTSLGARSTGYSIAIQPDKRIIVAGWVWTFGVGFGDDLGVARYNPDGSLDKTFDLDGQVQTGICCNDEAFSVAVQSDGKIVVAGGSFDATFETKFVVVRYNANGSLDTTFDSDGILVPSMGAGGWATAIKTQADGKILVAGVCWNGTLVLARLNSNGSLDTTFDLDGKVTTPGFYDASIVVQPNGKIVLAGTSYIGSERDFEIIRYDPDGSRDKTFGGGDGETTLDFGSSDESVSAITLDNAGRAVVVGSSGGRVAVARVLLEQQVSVSGRVTNPDGHGLRNAVVSLTDQFGLARTTITSSFGYYSFPDVPAGSTCTILATSRRYKFTPQTLTINADLTGVDFVGTE